MSEREQLESKLANLRLKMKDLGQRLAAFKKEKKTAEADAVNNQLKDVKSEVDKVTNELKEKFPEALRDAAEREKKEKEAAVQAKKAEKTTQAENSTRGTSAADILATDPLKEQFGTLPLARSTKHGSREWTVVRALDESMIGKQVWIRGRAYIVREKGSLCFIAVRQMAATVQAVVAKSDAIPRNMVKYAASISRESIIEIFANVTKPEVAVAGYTQKAVELQVLKIFVSGAARELPIQVEDASVPEPLIVAQEEKVAEIENRLKAAEAALADAGTKNGDVKSHEANIAALVKERDSAKTFVVLSQTARLDNRVIDLRTSANYGIFRIQSAVCTLFREFLLKNEFTEIHTPKLIGTASEGGAEVFEVKYFETKAYLAQSPQLYKQMAVVGDLERVFEIGPVFRAEKSFTHRHLCEFVGLDIEMAFHEHYFEVLGLLENMLQYVFQGVNERCKLELEAVRVQFPFEDVKFTDKPLRLNYREAIDLLRGAGYPNLGYLEDINTTQEKLLGKIIKEKYGVDVYSVCYFPTDVRAFYSMPCADDPKICNSYDLFLRGEEICSGAQRIHDPELLVERAKAKGVAEHAIQPYVDAFKYGAPPHGGAGFGLERIVMLFLGLGNIRKSSLFPRDPSRLSP